jgi:hypothetical protein
MKTWLGTEPGNVVSAELQDDVMESQAPGVVVGGRRVLKRVRHIGKKFLT